MHSKYTVLSFTWCPQVIRDELATLVQEYVQFTHGIPGFSDLPATDQAKLLKGWEAFEYMKYIIETYTWSGLFWNQT